MRVFAFVFPLALVAQGQALDQMLDHGPQWFSAIVVGAVFVLWVMDRTGKLPPPKGTGYCKSDREKAEQAHTAIHDAQTTVHKVYDLLGWKDDDGFPRFLRHVETTKAAIKRQEAAAEQQRQIVDILKRQSELLEAHNKAVAMMTEQFRTVNQKLDSIKHRLEKGA